MTFVVSDACIKCKHTDCVEVCPVDCFYEDLTFWSSTLTSVSTAHCASRSAQWTPFSQRMSFQKKQAFLELNAELCEIWPNITEKKDPWTTPKIGRMSKGS